MATVIVTRHNGLIQWLKNHGIEGQVIPHVESPEQIRGKDVIGVLPLSLASVTRSIWTVDMDLPPEARGKDLSPEEMDRFGAHLMKYEVREGDVIDKFGRPNRDSPVQYCPMGIPRNYIRVFPEQVIAIRLGGDEIIPFSVTHEELRVLPGKEAISKENGTPFFDREKTYIGNLVVLPGTPPRFLWGTPANFRGDDFMFSPGGGEE